MDDKWYSIEQISEMLKLHPRTLRRYINEGKLRANKVGKQFRISGHDLSIFLEGRNILETAQQDTAIKPKAEVSAIVDIETADKEQSERIERTLIAAMNSKDPSYGESSASMQRSAANDKLRVVLWGSIDYITAMLECISMLIKEREE